MDRSLFEKHVEDLRELRAAYDKLLRLRSQLEAMGDKWPHGSYYRELRFFERGAERQLMDRVAAVLGVDSSS